MSASDKKRKIEKDVRELVAEILETKPESIQGNAKFVQDLGMDSMMALEILAGIEKKYKIAIPEDSLPKFTDLNTTVDLVLDIVGSK